jgi:tRNA(Arg) A34 adenosine deaminase TadA
MEKNLKFIQEAIIEAKKSLKEGGIPIGAVLVKDAEIIGRGHNRSRQDMSTILHAEMDCLENAGHLTGVDYKKCILYTTLSPCYMCTGLILLYKIPRIVIGENETFPGPEDNLLEHGVELTNLNLQECKNMMQNYIHHNQDTWAEEIERVS